MASRPLIVATLVGASVGVPYFASQSPTGQKADGAAAVTPVGASSVVGPNGGVAGNGLAKPPAVGGGVPMGMPVSGGVYYPTTATAGPAQSAPRFMSLEQVLRFDVTKDFVTRNWTRKTVTPTDVGLTSVRVALVTGTQPSSLAGSLTYFFNAQGQVEHIALRGRTGDATPLVQLLTRYYQFQRVNGGIGEQVYQVRNGEGVQSELRTQPEGILRSDAPQQNVAVELEFARPGSPRLLPPRGTGLQIPLGAPVAEATSPAGPASGDGTVSSAKDAGGSYWDRVRYATPAEERERMWQRWPD